MRRARRAAMLRPMTAGFALAIALATALAAPFATADPALPRPGAPLVLAGGCHRDVQRHHVPEFRDTLRHRHAGGDCRPLPARERIAPLDCHRDVRRHFVPGLGVVLHRHVGQDCTIRRVSRSSEPKR